MLVYEVTERTFNEFSWDEVLSDFKKIGVYVKPIVTTDKEVIVVPRIKMFRRKNVDDELGEFYTGPSYTLDYDTIKKIFGRKHFHLTDLENKYIIIDVSNVDVTDDVFLDAVDDLKKRSNVFLTSFDLNDYLRLRDENVYFNMMFVPTDELLLFMKLQFPGIMTIILNNDYVISRVFKNNDLFQKLKSDYWLIYRLGFRSEYFWSLYKGNSVITSNHYRIYYVLYNEGVLK